MGKLPVDAAIFINSSGPNGGKHASWLILATTSSIKFRPSPFDNKKPLMLISV